MTKDHVLGFVYAISIWAPMRQTQIHLFDSSFGIIHLLKAIYSRDSAHAYKFEIKLALTPLRIIHHGEKKEVSLPIKLDC